MEQRIPNIVMPVAAALIGLVSIVGAVIYYGSQQMPLETPAISTTTATTTASSTPNRLAPFNETEYENAKLVGKPILLYFTASWCPECDYAKMRLKEAVADWPSEKLDIFLVNFSNPTASSTDPQDKLIELFQVTAPNTKILLRGENVVKQSTEVWTLERYREEVGALLK